MEELMTLTTSPDVDMRLDELRNVDTRIKATRLSLLWIGGSVTVELDDRHLAKFAASITDYLRLKAKQH